MTLVEFLLARIAEDEVCAKAAIEPDELYPWGDRALPRRSAADVSDDVRGYLGGTWGEHFARHDPARVLADCKAKRRIVESCGTVECGEGGPHHWPHEFAAYCDGCAAAEAAERGDILRLLALPYADHPSYDEAWRP